MYKFRVLEAFYDVCIELTYPNFHNEKFHCREHVIVYYQRNSNQYLFKFIDRENIRINSEAPEEIMDKLMIELGNSLYPFNLQISPNGEILEVNNFEEIQDRWKKKASELIKNNDTAPFKKYLKIAQRNMETEKGFRNTLTKNSFFKYYFLKDNAESFFHEVHHFPKRSDTTLFMFEQSKDCVVENNVLHYNASSVFPENKETSGVFIRKFTELGDLEILKVELKWEDIEGGTYKKQITIQPDMSKRDILKSNKFWSFLLD